MSGNREGTDTRVEDFVILLAGLLHARLCPVGTPAGTPAGAGKPVSAQRTRCPIRRL